MLQYDLSSRWDYMLPLPFILSATIFASHKIATPDILSEIEKRYYTTKEVSDILEITEYTVRKKFSQWWLEGWNFSRSRRVSY